MAEQWIENDKGDFDKGEPIKLPPGWKKLRPWIYVHDMGRKLSEEAIKEHAWTDESGEHLNVAQCPTCEMPLFPVLKWERGVIEACPLSAPQRPSMEAPDVGRNEACPCGSGKKYKKCCME